MLLAITHDPPWTPAHLGLSVGSMEMESAPTSNSSRTGRLLVNTSPNPHPILNKGQKTQNARRNGATKRQKGDAQGTRTTQNKNGANRAPPGPTERPNPTGTMTGRQRDGAQRIAGDWPHPESRSSYRNAAESASDTPSEADTPERSIPADVPRRFTCSSRV